MLLNNKDYILNKIINQEELARKQIGVVKVFNYSQLNKTVYYYYNHSKTNKTKYTLDDMIAEAYYLILTTIDKIEIDFNKDTLKYINYLNRCLTNHYHTLYNENLKDIKPKYIDDVYDDYDNRTGEERLRVEDTSTFIYFPVDSTYNNYINFIVDNKENIFNDKELLILEDIMYNKSKYSDKVKKMLKELNTTVNIDNHKNSLMNKISRRYNVWRLINEVLLGNYDDALKFIFKNKYNSNIKLPIDEVETLIQLLEYNIYSRDYFIKKYDYYYIYNIGLYIYQTKVKLYNKILAGDIYDN